MSTTIAKNTMALLVIAVTLSGCMPYSTKSTEVGVRTVKWSLTNKKGVEAKTYPPGSTFWFVPFINDWNTFDTRLRNLEMTATEGRGARISADELRFKTIDGNDIGLDIIISYRIDADKAPEILQKVATNDVSLEENIVRTITRSKPRDIFGELKTEDFYVASQRTKKSDEALKILNEIMEPYGIIVERVSTRDYRFSDDYQNAIEEKKVADQMAEKLEAETRAVYEEYLMKDEKAKALTEKVRAEADGEYTRAVIEADAYFEQQTRIAEAVLAEGRAQAEGILAMNKAMAGTGGREMVKLQIIESLKGKPIIMLPIGDGGIDLRSTDINGLLDLMGIQKLSEVRKAPVAKTTVTPGKPPLTNVQK